MAFGWGSVRPSSGSPPPCLYWPITIRERQDGGGDRSRTTAIAMASAAAMILPFLLLALAMVGVARPNYSSSSSAAATTGLVSWTNGMGWTGTTSYGLQPMRWDKKLARQARRWSNAMRGGRFAESLYIGRNGWNATASDAVRRWGDRETGNCTGALDFKECGHFAFMVKPNFSRIGCARAECFNGGVFITCNYYKDKDGVHR